MVTASRTNPRYVFTRNISFFKRLKVSKAESTTDPDVTELDEMDGDYDVLENNELYPDHIGREDESNEDQQNEENGDDELGNAENLGEQGNDPEERRQLAAEKVHEKELDIGDAGQAVVGRRQRRAPKKYEQYKMEDDYWTRYF